MFMSLQKHIKITRRIPREFYLNMHVEIHNNKSIDVGSLA